MKKKYKHDRKPITKKEDKKRKRKQRVSLNYKHTWRGQAQDIENKWRKENE